MWDLKCISEPETGEGLQEWSCFGDAWIRPGGLEEGYNGAFILVNA